MFLLNSENFQTISKKNESLKIIDEIEYNTPFCWATSSGSISLPKITEQTYRSIMEDTYRQIRAHAINANDKIDVLSSLGFSASLSSIFPALFSGASLHIKEESKNIGGIYDFWLENEITMTTMIPSMFRNFVKLPFDFKKTNLRFICLAGEPVQINDFKIFQKTFNSHVKLQAALASSETRAIAEFIGEVNQVYDFESIKYNPVEGKEILILDAEGNRVPAGEKGTIAVQSAIIGSKYVNHSGGFQSIPNDAILFVSNDVGSMDADGVLTMYRNNNRVIKHKGLFLDLDLLESSLLGISEIEECHISENETQQAINAFIYSTEDRVLIRDKASNVLQNITYNFYFLECPFPKLYSGKINFKELYTFSFFKDEEVIVDKNEEKLYNIWKEMFPSESNFRGKHFFNDLGGDSMRALLLVVRLEEIYNSKFDPGIVYKFPVYEDLLERLETKSSYVVKKLTHKEGLKDILIFSNVAGNYDSYNGLIDELKEQFNISIFQYTFSENNNYLTAIEIARRNAAFIKSEGKKYNAFIGFSFSGLLAYQTASFMQNYVESVFLIDTPTYKKHPVVIKKLLKLERNLVMAKEYLVDKDRRGYIKDRFKQKILVKNQLIKESKQSAEQSVKKNYFSNFFKSIAEQNHEIRKTHFSLGIFEASIKDAFRFDIAPNYDWHKYNSNICFLKELPGNHLGMLEDQKNVKKIAETIREQ